MPVNDNLIVPNWYKTAIDVSMYKSACATQTISLPCLFFHLFIFLAETDSVEKINTVVHGVIVGVPVPFPLPDPDACVNHGLSCPLKKDETNTYYATLQVLKSYPKVSRSYM